MNKLFLTALALAATLAAIPATALAAAENAAGQTTSAAPSADMSDGVVRKVDKAQGKITIKHGPLKNLDMPSMTMIFQVKDKALLDTVKDGDKVQFNAMDDNGKLVVTEIKKIQ